jgi:hypothetical protein
MGDDDEMNDRPPSPPGPEKMIAIKELPQAPSPATLPTPPLASDLQSHIGRQLQAVYDEVLHEPVPDRFLKLLQELERKTGGV